jgi:hypothetical protein
VTLNQKVEIYTKLVAGLGKGVKLVAVLDRLGSTAERKEVEKSNEELAKQAGALRKKIQKQWNVQAKTTLEKIQASSAKLQRQIRSIEKTRKTGEKVVKALGFIDELIDLAKTVAKAMA